jgi:hypothetical protein
MTDELARAATIRRLAQPWLAWSATALLSLILLLAPQASHAAAFSATDVDAIGRWAGDAKNPINSYQVTPGSQPGEVVLISPPELGLAPIELHRVASTAFASAPGVAPTATLTVTKERHARLKIHDSSKKGLSFTYLLLDKQQD